MEAPSGIIRSDSEMKKYVLLILVLCAFSFYAAEHFAEKQTLRIGVECDYAPNNWLEDHQTDTNLPIVNEPGHYAEGYDIQIAKLVAEEMNAVLEVRKFGWNELIPALARREIDAVFSGMLDTQDRHKNADFSDTYDVAKTEYTIVVNRASPYADAETLSDFSGARLVAQNGTTLDKAIAQISGAVHLPPVSTVQDMLNMVVNNKADGTVINFDTGQTYERKYKNLKVIRFPDGKGFDLDFKGICAGVRKGNTKLLEEINHALAKISKRDRQRIMDRTISRAFQILP